MEEDPERLVKKGDRFYDRYGKAVIVVDKFHPRQTWAYWVTGASYQFIKEELLEYGFTSEGDGIGWPIDQGRWDKNNKDLLALCLLSEWDPEENEFGVITP